MRLRFTIRDLLWLAALVAVCLAWWVDRQRLLDPGLPFVRIYPVKSAAAAEIAAFLAPGLTATNQSVRVAADERTNSLIVIATANQHAAIAKVLSELEAQGEGLKLTPATR